MKLWNILYLLSGASFVFGDLIALRQRNVDKLLATVHDVSDPNSPEYQKWWSREDISALTEPTEYDKKVVMDWLVDCGIESETVVDYGDAFYVNGDVSCKGMPEQVEFIERRKVAIDLAETFHGTISENVKWGYVTRDVFTRLGKIVPDALGVTNPVTIAAAEFGWVLGILEDDLNTSQMENGVIVTNLTEIIGPYTYPSPYPGASADIQLASYNSGVDLMYIGNTEGWMYTLTKNLQQVIPQPDVVTISYGWASWEQTYPAYYTSPGISSAEYIHRTDVEFAKIALSGTTIVSSSGIAGSPGQTNPYCVEEVAMNPIYPCSSPYVLCVGSTYLVNDQTCDEPTYFQSPVCNYHECNPCQTQHVAQYPYTNWTSGAGFGIYSDSIIHSKWQTNAIEEYFASGVALPPLANFNVYGRAYPDLVTVGHNCPVWLEGELYSYDGSACSSAVLAAYVSYWASRLNGKLGLITPTLYHLYHSHKFNNTDLFTDITVGYTGCNEHECCYPQGAFGFYATEGYDVASGLGAPLVDGIANALQELVSQSFRRHGV